MLEEKNSTQWQIYILYWKHKNTVFLYKLPYVITQQARQVDVVD